MSASYVVHRTSSSWSIVRYVSTPPKAHILRPGNASSYQRIGFLPVRLRSLFKIWIWKFHRESFFVHAGLVPAKHIYVCELMLKSSIIFTYFVSEVDPRLSEASRQCFSSLLLYSSTW
jgi:hypothetical protein